MTIAADQKEGLAFQTGTPDEPGEYQASMDPPPMPDTVRYYWNGKKWSEPYHSSWPEILRAEARARISEFQACRYWRKVQTEQQ